LNLTEIFSVEVYSWKDGDEFRWNVYAYLFDTHPMFNNVKWAKMLPFQRGCNYSKYITYEPATKREEQWEQTAKLQKLGCDYNHYGDYFECDDPKDGISSTVLRDANLLVKELQEIFDAHQESVDKTEQSA
jgi:hypothetical protein